MFGKKEVPMDTRTVGTIIGKETAVQGNMTGGGSLRVEGRVEGEIEISGDLFVGETGRVKANVRAQNVVIAGEVRGNVECVKRLEVAATGRLYGDIKTALLVIEEGAIIKGNMEMADPHAREEETQREGGVLQVLKPVKGAAQKGDATSL